MQEWEMFSLMDLTKYHMSNDVFTGGVNNIRAFENEYQRLEKLGEGSNSIVYRVKEKKSDKIVALKLIKHPELKSKLPQNIFREISILKSLNHEHVIKLIDVFMDVDPQQLLLTFELCSYDLSSYIRAHQHSMITNDQVKCIALQLFRGLNYIHKNWIIHRDIKPQNLLITENGQLKIIDFGISRRFSYLVKPLTPGAMTLYYQAPELLFESKDYDEKVDIWSAGCVVVELITKKPLFECQSQVDLIKKVSDILGFPNDKDWPSFKTCARRNVKPPNVNTVNKLVDHLQALKCGPAYDILSGIFVYNPNNRCSAEVCVRHDWFEQAPFPSKTIDKPEVDIFRLDRMLS